MNWYRKAKKEEDIDDIFPSKWKEVDSSFIDAAAYYEPLGMFEVKFKNGTEYSYRDVPKDVFDEFMKSPSKGEFFNRVIKEKYGRGK